MAVGVGRSRCVRSTRRVFYIVAAWGRFHISAYLAISGPLFVMAGLFLANWVLRKELRPDK